MTKIETPTLLTAEELIKQCAAWCAETGDPPSKLVTDEMLALCTDEAYEELALKGLMYETNNQLHYDRDARRDSGGGVEQGIENGPFRGPSPLTDDAASPRPGNINISQGRNPNAAGVGSYFSALDIYLMGVDQMKRLRDFTRADLKALYGYFKGKRIGMQRREQWCDYAASVLTDDSMTISELKEHQIKELEELADKAWSKDESAG